MSLAVVILTYNEVLHLERALEHVRAIADEIFVIDSYSTDATVAIARAHGAQVLEHAFRNQAEQFNWALDHAPIQSDWVLRLDADEIVEPDLAEEILRELPRLPAEVTGVNLRRKTIFQGRFLRYGGRYPLVMLRLWRRGKARVEARWMDEHLYVTEGRTVTFQGGFADHSLIDLTAFTDKHNRYATREAMVVLLDEFDARRSGQALTAAATSLQVSVKRWIKQRVYDRVPFEISAFGYFFFRYVLLLGFLDGRPGLVYHVLQGFWYRFLVGAKLRELRAATREDGSRAELEQRLLELTGLRPTEPAQGS